MNAKSENTVQIWMGSLEPYMTEQFIMGAFIASGERPLGVKVIKNKEPGAPPKFCFVHFESEARAEAVLHRLNGTVIPNSRPHVKFKLNVSAMKGTGRKGEHSLFVGNLNTDVDGLTLYSYFSSRYNSVKWAKVATYSDGFSRGYGFVDFESEAQMITCAAEMDGFTGFGGKPLNIGFRNKDKKVSQPPEDYFSYDDSVWQQYPWQSCLDFKQLLCDTAPDPMSFEGKDFDLIEPSRALSVDEMNNLTLSSDLDFWDSIENTKWSAVETLYASDV